MTFKSLGEKFRSVRDGEPFLQEVRKTLRYEKNVKKISAITKCYDMPYISPSPLDAAIRLFRDDILAINS